MLLLVFRIAGARYAVDAARVVEVVPRVELRAVPHAPGAVAGLFLYRGVMVPVVDLGILFGMGPCPPLLSTRIILAEEELPSPPEGRASLGLIAEHVSEVQEVADERVVPPPAVLGQNPYLRSIATCPDGLIPLVDVARIRTERARRALDEAAP